MSMNPEIKAKWIEALRSGKYRQGSDFLQHSSRFCCLGVLCDVMGAEWLPDPHEQGALLPKSFSNNDEEHLLSPNTLVRMGFSHKTQNLLAKMNDNGRSFSEIADYIEANL